ncbi:MAG TPA: PSD1 and planctomycete cytochrome C domain-containing protein, partial [Isosphaeraceae bacterium]|nr:PSD1 and planctomycete cytochrome C domain-containing protein [Isosphaeraceae bacterium]
AKQKGGLRLDARTALLVGGSTGPALVPGNPAESLLVDAINYGEALQMPPKSKLPDAEIAALTEWVKRGAPWGIQTPVATANAADAKPSDKSDQLSREEYQKRARFWSFQPIKQVTPPALKTGPLDWARNPIDQFIQSAMTEHGLAPSPEADRRTLIRRLSFDLLGLPPSPTEVAAFVADAGADAYERLVDRLLASPRYGERWARHWLDLVRYAETGGHEFDYDIVNAFGYRDYVIRALNADLSYDRFVTEQIAGDLLDPPRRSAGAGSNESILGTGFYFLGEGTHSPVDVREEQMRRIDNQIDVMSKAFLGLTVACARCHDHKFDPITNKDYYALAGVLRSSRHQQAFIDPPQRFAPAVGRLLSLKSTIASLIREAMTQAPEVFSRETATVWTRCASDESSARQTTRPSRSPKSDEDETVFEDFHGDSFDGWSVTGDAFGDGPSRAGGLRLELVNGGSRLVSIKPGQAHSGLISDRLRGVLRSRSFTIENRYVHWLVAGKGGRISVVVDGFEKIRDPIYGELTRRIDAGDHPRWVTQDLGMWIGHSAYFEISDGSTVDFGGGSAQIEEGRGYIAVDEIRLSNRSTPAPPVGSDSDQLPGVTEPALELAGVIKALHATAHDAAADRLAAAVEEVRATEQQIPDPTLALAIADGTGQDERIHIRGSHKNLGEIVPRRFLEILGGSDSATSAGSGRLYLARRMVDPRLNPLLSRVLVNRLWKHHFGEGIVKSTDDFGAMGQKPSHPELLDWLVSELLAHDWSWKAIHRLMVTSSTYRMVSTPHGDLERLDPTNTFLHRMNVRRLEAEAIRDALLAVSGRLVPSMYGKSTPVHLTSFMEGRGRPRQSGPLDGDGRRSLYLSVRRNFLNPMFLAFDTPAPFSTMGRRNVSNVPAQALTLMNDPLVVGQARLWAERIVAGPSQSAPVRLDNLYEIAFSRPPTLDEARACLEFLDRQMQAGHAGQGYDTQRQALAWTALCHVLVNMKEFIFID